MKSLKDVSLPISEEEYRNDGCMHYSTIASYDRGGFGAIPTLFDRKESPSLEFGGIVDVLITGTPDEFEKHYLVADLNSDSSDTLINVTKGLFNVYKDTYTQLSDIPQEILIASLNEINYGKTWYPKTRIDKLIKAGAEYYRLMYLAKDKTIISTNTYNDALACVKALHEAPSTKFIFAPNNPFEPEIERLYQLKFKANYKGVDFSCMCDAIVVFHNTKKILPIDLKTSFKHEYDFYKSFLEWSYSMQARQYYYCLYETIKDDDYFKDFEILNWHFVVVNKQSLNPLVWEYEDTKKRGTLYYGKDNHIELRDPLEVGIELKHYLDNPVSVPNGVYLNKPNSLKEWLNNI
jgi:hypothetical protein